jgi:hypothetical protein
MVLSNGQKPRYSKDQSGEEGIYIYLYVYAFFMCFSLPLLLYPLLPSPFPPKTKVIEKPYHDKHNIDNFLEKQLIREKSKRNNLSGSPIRRGLH